MITKNNSSLVFLYPNDPIKVHCVDESYSEEYLMMQQSGLSVHLIDIENILESKIYPAMDDNVTIVYRGWMLSDSAYTQLEQRFAHRLLTPKNSYLYSH